jgi:hypothetical protein
MRRRDASVRDIASGDVNDAKSLQTEARRMLADFVGFRRTQLFADLLRHHLMEGTGRDVRLGLMAS